MNVIRTFFVWISGILFVVLLFPVTILFWVLFLPFGLNETVVHWWLTLQGYILCRCNPVWTIKTAGRENHRKKETYIIISNHQSLLDILLITSLRFRLRWISKIENFRIPLLSLSMKMAGYIPVDRGNAESKVKMMQKSLKSLKEGVSVMMFPEGTRSNDGSIAPFKKGAFELAIQSRRPLLPVIIDGTWNVLPKKSILFKNGSQLKIKILEPVYPDSFTTSDPEVLAAIMRDKMVSGLAEMRQLNNQYR